MRQYALAFAICLAACSPDPAADRAPETQAAAENYAASGWVAKTLPEIADALAAGDVTSEALVEAYLSRIERVDRAGPKLQSVLAINPDALDDARASDARRAAGEAHGALDGVPVLLKDNIESKDPIATTAGALALMDNVTGRDSPLAAGLRAQGAIILGKTNLSQWANFRSNDSMSGWSALGGQVRNPHMLDRNPCGSSSGSGAAVAASLAAGAVGTETNGSIICPSNANGVVGFKPSVGLISQAYIVPISSSQDTAGPMTKTVTGAAMMLNAMADTDTAPDFVSTLDANALNGVRIGVMNFSRNEHSDINARFDRALEDMKSAGAILVDIDEFAPSAENFWGKAFDVLKYEFKATLNAYLADAAPAVETRSLDALIAFNDANAETELALFDQSIFLASNALGGLDDEEYLTARADIQSSTRKDGIDMLLRDYDVAVLVSPTGVVASRIDPVNGDVWPDWAGGGYLAAVAGYPHATVPMGTVHGLPVGISFMGGNNEDANILSVAFAYEQATMHRVEPQYLENAETRPEIAAAMARRGE